MVLMMIIDCDLAYHANRLDHNVNASVYSRYFMWHFLVFIVVTWFSSALDYFEVSSYW